MEAFRKRILDAINAAPDLDLKSVSKTLGRNDSYMYQFIHRGVPRRLDGDDRRKLAMLLKMREEDLLPEGEEADDLKSIAVYDTSEAEFIKIPVYDVQASAGNGCLVSNESILYHLSFRNDFIDRITRAPLHKLAVIRVEGDSMQPTLWHDDLVLVDMTQKHPRADGIYVVLYDETLLVKRVRIDPVRRLATISSDNPLYPPVENLAPEDIRIAGTVLWRAGRI